MRALKSIYFFVFLVIGLQGEVLTISGQQPQTPGAPLTLPNTPQRDTNTNKTNTNDWRNANARISYKYFHSEKLYTPDTSIHTIHRRPFLQPWYRDLGNHGSPAYNALFTPEYRVGPTLGYRVFDVYRYNADSLKYYNTNRPYSSFSYQLGGKQEQTAEIMHTQNVRPNLNFAVGYRKITSPGYYQIQRTNHDNAYLSTNYQSRNQRYELYGAVVYNKEQNDENGSILYDSLLNDDRFDDRQTIPTRFFNASYGSIGRNRRSSVSNTLRDFSALLQHSYTLGRTDTLYSEDSSSFRTRLTPRFRISHRMQYHSEKYQFKDVRPDSLRYSPFFAFGFKPAARDSVYMRQDWEMFDNRLALNGFIGDKENQIQVTAGLGSRADNFRTEYHTGSVRNKIFSTYLVAELGKESLDTGQWSYKANGLLYLTGEAAGSSTIQAEVGKDIFKDWVSLMAGIRQDLNIAPYNYTLYQTQYDTISSTFNKESVSQLYAAVSSPRLNLSAGLRSYLVGNYIYLDSLQLPRQNSNSFSITQLWLRKVFHWRSIVFDNEITYQQLAGSAPVNVPALLGRHQLSFERYILKNALKLAVGAEVRYHSPFDAPGYAPFFNRFYYQDFYRLENEPEISLFFNFKIKRFRAYVMADQFQQILWSNVTRAKGYPAQDMMVRFGFTWVLIN